MERGIRVSHYWSLALFRQKTHLLSGVDSRRNEVSPHALHYHGIESEIEQDGDDGVIDEEEAVETEPWTATLG